MVRGTAEPQQTMMARALQSMAHICAFVPVETRTKSSGLTSSSHDFGTAPMQMLPLSMRVSALPIPAQLPAFPKDWSSGCWRRPVRQVKQVHVGIGNVLDGDKPRSSPSLSTMHRCRSRHRASGVPGGRTLISPSMPACFRMSSSLIWGLTSVHRRAGSTPKMLQNKVSLAADMPGAAGLRAQAFQAAAVFQPGIGKGRADRVGIGVPVPDDVDAAHRFCCYVFFPLGLVFGKTASFLTECTKSLFNYYPTFYIIAYYFIICDS